MELASVKSITIPEGNVKQVAINNVVIWKAAPTEPYTLITPSDIDKFPATLNGYAYENFTGKANAQLTNPPGTIIGLNWLSKHAVVRGHAYSEIAISVPQNSELAYQKMFMGWPAKEEPDGTVVLSICCSTTSIGLDAGNALIDAANAHILYELFESDGSIWKAVRRNSDGATGYYNEEEDIFIQPIGGIPYN